MDYIVSRNELYFLEVNTVPGLSEASIIPKQAAEFGIPIKKLFSMMIEDAIFRSKKS
jgi:D-alanine-D-alanine ligase